MGVLKKIMYRIKKYKNGWVVEQKHKTWYGKVYWKYCISVAGIDSQPWHHSTFDCAMRNLYDLVREQTYENSDEVN